MTKMTVEKHSEIYWSFTRKFDSINIFHSVRIQFGQENWWKKRIFNFQPKKHLTDIYEREREKEKYLGAKQSPGQWTAGNLVYLVDNPVILFSATPLFSIGHGIYTTSLGKNVNSNQDYMQMVLFTVFWQK